MPSITPAGAAARGRGRKPVVTGDKRKRATKHLASGPTVHEAGVRIKVSKTALYATLKADHSGAPNRMQLTSRTPCDRLMKVAQSVIS